MEFLVLGDAEYLAKAGFSNSMIEAAIESTKQKSAKYQELVTKMNDNEQEMVSDAYQTKRSIPDLNAYENMPAVRMSVLMKNRQSDQMNQIFEDPKLMSAINAKNMEPSDSKRGLITHGYYKHFKGTDFILEDKQTRNIPYNVKGEPGL